MRMFTMNATGTVHAAPDPFMSDLDEITRAGVRAAAPNRRYVGRPFPEWVRPIHHRVGKKALDTTSLLLVGSGSPDHCSECYG